MDLEYKKILSSNFIHRLITTLFLLPVILYCTYKGGYWSKSLVLISSIFLANEWFLLTQNKTMNIDRYIFIVLIFFSLLLSIFLYFPFSILVILFFSLFYTFNFLIKKNTDNYKKWLLYGFLYICIPLLIFIHIQNLYDDKILLIWFLVVVFSTDIFSYIFGKLIKGPKIFPITSPSKTYSGTFLGIFFASTSGIVFSLMFINNIKLSYNIIFCILISSSALFGDFFISKIKRIFKVKNSGNLLPGHGGFLDRYDSIAFSLIVLFFLIYFF